MNKNPFEIRLEMLTLAKDYMDNAWTMNMEFTRSMFIEGKKTAEDVEAAMKPYSIEELMKKAQEMYNFVSKKD